MPQGLPVMRSCRTSQGNQPTQSFAGLVVLCWMGTGWMNGHVWGGGGGGGGVCGWKACLWGWSGNPAEAKLAGPFISSSSRKGSRLRRA